MIAATFAFIFCDSDGEFIGGDEVTPGTVGNNDRKRLSMQMSQAQAEQLEELDSIRIKTMYQMVEDVQISHEGLLLNRKLLYLTNKQARSFNVSNIKNVFEALELPSSHFVIRLMQSLYGVDMILTPGRGRDACGGPFYPGTLSIHDVNATETQLMLFVKGVYFACGNADKSLILVGAARMIVLLWPYKR